MKYQVIAPLHLFLAHSYRENKFPDQVTLEGGYQIKRLDIRPLEQVFDDYKRFISEYDQKQIKDCKYAIYYEYEDSSSGYSGIPDKVMASINSIMYALRVVRPTRVTCTIINFEKVNGKLTLPRDLHQRRGSDILFYDQHEAHQSGEPRYQFFMKKDQYKIRKYFKNISYLYDTYTNKYNRVLNALIFFEIAHAQTAYKVRLITLVTGLESLFNTSNEQVGYKLRLRCSFFLTKDPAKRMEISKELSTVYALRSLFVHGQGLEDDDLIQDEDKQKRLMIYAEDTLRECLQKTLSDRQLIKKFDKTKKLSWRFDELIAGKRKVL